MLKKVKGRTWAVIGVVIILLMALLFWTSSPAKAMTIDDAKNLAYRVIPKSAEYVDGKENENKFAMVFCDSENNEIYMVQVSKKTQKIKKIETIRDDSEGSQTIILKKADIEKLIREKFPEVQWIRTELEKDDGLYEYNVDFKGDGFYGDADINPETGLITECTVKMGTAVTIPKSGSGTGASDGGSQWLTAEQAMDAALKVSGGGICKDIEIEKVNGRYYFEVEIVKENMEIEYLVDAETGEVKVGNVFMMYKIKEKDTRLRDEAPPKVTGSEGSGGSSEGPLAGGKSGAPVTADPPVKNSYISAEQVKAIVLAKIPGAQITDLEMDVENGRHVYEAEAVLDGYEYDFKIDPVTGVVIELEKDLID